MCVFRIIMAMLATVACAAPAVAQDAAPEGSAAIQPSSPVKAGQPEPRDGYATAARETTEAAEQGWRWSVDGDRPALEYRVSERATLRLRGTGLFLNLRF